MELNRKNFEILAYIAENNDEKCSQRKLSSELNMSLGVVNKIVAELIDDNALVYDNNSLKITEYGFELLEPYRVKRAILLAAGFGSRMRPITLNTPKPLVLVRGKRIIETIIDALMDAGINEIYIVRGYLGEQFDVLKNKYPNLILVDNPMYNESNNFTSAYLVRDKFENAYVCESDLYIHNPKIIKKYQYGSNYTGRYTDVSDDWCFEVKNGFIDKLKIGGEKVYHTYCVAYFSLEDGKKMKKDLEVSFDLPGAKEKVWDYVALEYFKEHYNMYVRDVKMEDIVEIDSFNELKQIDKTYDV